MSCQEGEYLIDLLGYVCGMGKLVVGVEIARIGTQIKRVLYSSYVHLEIILKIKLGRKGAICSFSQSIESV